MDNVRIDVSMIEKINDITVVLVDSNIIEVLYKDKSTLKLVYPKDWVRIGFENIVLNVKDFEELPFYKLPLLINSENTLLRKLALKKLEMG